MNLYILTVIINATPIKSGVFFGIILHFVNLAVSILPIHVLLGKSLESRRPVEKVYAGSSQKVQSDTLEK